MSSIQIKRLTGEAKAKIVTVHFKENKDLAFARNRLALSGSVKRRHLT
jgi:hypothetical protein